MQERLLKLPEILAMLGIRKTKFYDLVKQGKIPSAIKPSPRAAFWKQSDINSVMNEIASGALRF